MENFDNDQGKISVLKQLSVLEKMRQAEEVLWINPEKTDFEESMRECELGQKNVEDAEQRLLRFAPLIQKYFPETQKHQGLIESPLVEIETMKQRINKKYKSNLEGNLMLKEDSHLAIAGSAKARGGIYEVLKHT